MQFSMKISAILMALACSAISGQAASTAERGALNELSVVFYDDVSFTGAIFAPSPIGVNHCYDLPEAWASRPESLSVAAGYICTFHVHAACSGAGIALTGNVASLSQTSTPPLYNNIKSFSCNEA